MERNILVKNEMMITILMMTVVILHVTLNLSGPVLEEMKIVKILVKNEEMGMLQVKTKVNELLFEEMALKELQKIEKMEILKMEMGETQLVILSQDMLAKEETSLIMILVISALNLEDM